MILYHDFIDDVVIRVTVAHSSIFMTFFTPTDTHVFLDREMIEIL